MDLLRKIFGAKNAPEKPDFSKETPYQTLGIPWSASAQEIKAAYFAEVKKYSPEIYPEQFMAIRKAYELLKEADTKAEVDVTWLAEPLLPIAFSGISETPSSQVKINQSLAEAEQAANAGDAVAQEQRIRLLKERSLCLVERKAWQEAMADWKTILNLQPDDAETVRNLRNGIFQFGLSLARQNNYQPAYDVFRELLEAEPGVVVLIHNVALLAGACDDYTESVRMWNALFSAYKAQLDESAGDEYLTNLVVEVQKKIAENTARIPTEKVEKKPAFTPQAPEAKAGVKLAVSLMEQKLYPQAIQILENSLREGDNSLDVVDNLGWAYVHLGSIEEGFRVWRKGLRDHNQHPRLKDSIIRGHVHVGKTMLENKHITPALTHLKQALAADSKNIEAYDLLAQIYLQKGDPLAAIDLWTKALKLDPRDKRIQRSIRAAKIRTRR